MAGEQILMRDLARTTMTACTGLLVFSLLGATEVSGQDSPAQCAAARRVTGNAANQVVVLLRAQFGDGIITLAQYNEQYQIVRRRHLEIWNKLKAGDCTALARDWCDAFARDYNVSCAW